ncbi:MAG: GNAT family N-acetyltransferase [Flavobacteriales bacterium]|nr:GNAT family N-acetyltransferase [Flavobacteriales bacterium]
MSDSVIIEPIEKDDYQGLFRLIEAERERLLPYFPVTCAHCSDPRATRSYIKDMIARAKRKEFFCFAMRDYEGGDPIGLVFLKEFDWTVPKCETAYFIGSIYERKGLTTLGVMWAVDYAFTQLNMEKVFARVDPLNVASCKVLQYCGFELEGTLRRDYRTADGRLLDLQLFSVLK